MHQETDLSWVQELRVPFASFENHWVRPQDVVDGQHGLRCWLCSKAVSVVREHERGGFSVRRHFAHLRDSDCVLAGQTWQHAAAKLMVAGVTSRWLRGEGPAPRVVRRCGSCSTTREGEIGSRRRILGAAVEQRVEVRGQSFTVDVALLGEDRGVVGAVEIYMTHLIGEPKRGALEGEGIPVVEVVAHDVLSSPLVWVDREPLPACSACKKAAAERRRREAEEARKRRQVEEDEKRRLQVLRSAAHHELEVVGGRGRHEGDLAVCCPETWEMMSVERECFPCRFFIEELDVAAPTGKELGVRVLCGSERGRPGRNVRVELETVRCPKRRDHIFLDECRTCEHHRGLSKRTGNVWCFFRGT